MYMSVLGKDVLWDSIKKREIVVTPLLDPDQVQDSSIDVRLGNEFIVIRKTRLSSLDLGNRDKFSQQLHRYQARTRIEYGKEFILHPGQLILGATLEYIRLPNNVAAYVIGKSSWGRMGLIIATATAVAPGYCGTPTLEIVNLGEIPLSVHPGLRIAQLVLHKCDGQGGYGGKYRYTTGPGFSRVCEDPELDFWLDPLAYRREDDAP
jgi:dCTP deaminase